MCAADFEIMQTLLRLMAWGNTHKQMGRKHSGPKRSHVTYLLPSYLLKKTVFLTLKV